MTFWFCFLLLLFQIDQSITQTPAPQCDRNDLRLIRGPTDISDILSSLSSSDCPIVNLLSPFPCTHWCGNANTLPNSILIIFNKPLILEGLSTEGTNNGFVSDFTLYYSSVLEEQLKSFIRVSLPSDNGQTFFFPYPIKAEKIYLTMNSVRFPPFGYYYWHLDIIGCTATNTPLTNTTNPADTGSEDGNGINNQNITMISSSFITDVLPTSNDVEPTASSLKFSDMICTDTTITHSLTIRETFIITQTITTTLAETGRQPTPSTSFSIVESSSDSLIMNKYGIYIFPGLAGFSLLLFITTLVIIVAAVMKRKYDSSAEKKRSNTLMEVDNINLYELENEDHTINTSKRTVIPTEPPRKLPAKPPPTLSVPASTSVFNQYYSKHNEMTIPLINEADEMYASLNKYQKPTDGSLTNEPKQYESLD